MTSKTVNTRFSLSAESIFLIYCKNIVLAQLSLLYPTSRKILNKHHDLKLKLFLIGPPIYIQQSVRFLTNIMISTLSIF